MLFSSACVAEVNENRRNGKTEIILTKNGSNSLFFHFFSFFAEYKVEKLYCMQSVDVHLSFDSEYIHYIV